jgi:hypothetical protein
MIIAGKMRGFLLISQILILKGENIFHGKNGKERTVNITNVFV